MKKNYKGIVVSLGYVESASLASFRLAYLGDEEFSNPREFAEFFIEMIINSYLCENYEQFYELLDEMKQCDSGSANGLIETIEPLGWNYYDFQNGQYVHLSEMYWTGREIKCFVKEEVYTSREGEDESFTPKFVPDPKKQIRKQALAKLTKEEKQALGLK